MFRVGALLDSTLTWMSASLNDELSFPDVDLILIDSVTRSLAIPWISLRSPEGVFDAWSGDGAFDVRSSILINDQRRYLRMCFAEGCVCESYREYKKVRIK